jgi:hypothetical protein
VVENPPRGYTRVAPYLLYEDPAAALEWLARAFGFRERFRHPLEDGRIDHAEMEFEDGLIMLARPAPRSSRSRRRNRTGRSSTGPRIRKDTSGSSPSRYASRPLNGRSSSDAAA